MQERTTILYGLDVCATLKGLSVEEERAQRTIGGIVDMCNVKWYVFANVVFGREREARESELIPTSSVAGRQRKPLWVIVTK